MENGRARSPGSLTLSGKQLLQSGIRTGYESDGGGALPQRFSWATSAMGRNVVFSIPLLAAGADGESARGGEKRTRGGGRGLEEAGCGAVGGGVRALLRYPSDMLCFGRAS